jgi:glycine cleavage system H protein
MTGPMRLEDLRYTSQHEWVRVEGEIGTVGITAYAQEALGDVVYVTLPEPGDRVEVGQACGEVESTKSVSEVYTPVTGVVVQRNEALDTAPELVNSDPYGEGWLFAVRFDDAGSVGTLLTLPDYQALLG